MSELIKNKFTVNYEMEREIDFQLKSNTDNGLLYSSENINNNLQTFGDSAYYQCIFVGLESTLDTNKPVWLNNVQIRDEHGLPLFDIKQYKVIYRKQLKSRKRKFKNVWAMKYAPSSDVVRQLQAPTKLNPSKITRVKNITQVRRPGEDPISTNYSMETEFAIIKDSDNDRGYFIVIEDSVLIDSYIRRYTNYKSTTDFWDLYTEEDADKLFTFICQKDIPFERAGWNTL